MGRILLVVGTAVGVVGLLALVRGWLGGDSVGFAVAVVWLPMTGLGTVSHVVPFRLPARLRTLRPFEHRGRLYERLGVGLFKRLLRRGPATWFNPGLRLPAEPGPESLARLAQRMSVAEASHAVLLVATLPVAIHAAARGWWPAALTTLMLDVLVNGYPVMLQRYNRARLRARFGVDPAG